jgi:BirA family biotin operon repressor/biotin-[acetyl-CoA-carboxylase] ligase
MYEDEIRAALGEVPLSGLQFYDSIGSTNDAAAEWLKAGAADLSLVVADEQTAGRGRSGNQWFTPAATALAFSLILSSELTTSPPAISRLAGLGALGMADGCARLGLEATIKWPNDLLVGGRKVGGTLVETHWTGDEVEAAILGIGINVRPDSVPPRDAVSYPASCVEHELGTAVNRASLLREMVLSLLHWRVRLASDEFLAAWESRLAFRGRRVALITPNQPDLEGTLLGLATDGSARVETAEGVALVQSGQIHLRPSDDRIG